MVEIAVREHDAFDGGVTWAARVQRRKALDLRTDLRGGVDQEPAPAVGAHRHRLLGARRRPDGPVPHARAVRTAAVPLREPAAGSGAEDPDEHVEPPSKHHSPSGGLTRAWKGCRKARKRLVA